MGKRGFKPNFSSWRTSNNTPRLQNFDKILTNIKIKRVIDWEFKKKKKKKSKENDRKTKRDTNIAFIQLRIYKYNYY